MTFTLKGFDENGNGILDGVETVKFYDEVFYVFPDSESYAALKRNWADSGMDDSRILYKTYTKAEFVQFYLRNWVSSLKHEHLVWGSSLLLPWGAVTIF